jgi:hypothetical protein
MRIHCLKLDDLTLYSSVEFIMNFVAIYAVSKLLAL